MAITIDWATKTINVPRADMIMTQSAPTEIRQLDLNQFRLQLKAIESSLEGMGFLRTHTHNAGVTVGGAVLSQVIQVINGYSVTFEDGQYRVNTIGANSNIGEVTNVNQVSVSTSNSAGLQDLNSLQAASFGGEIAFDNLSSNAGTIFPTGTKGVPVNNLADAHKIALDRGIRTILFISSATISNEIFAKGFEFKGANVATVFINILPSAGVKNCIFSNAVISGTLDGGNVIKDCSTLNLTFFNGQMRNCAVEGSIILGGGVDAEILDCWGSITGGAGTHRASIDMGGSGNDLFIRNFSGDLVISNSTGSHASTVDMSSGTVIFGNTNTGGDFIVRGIAEVIDGSNGATIFDKTINDKIIDLHRLQGLDANNPLTVDDAANRRYVGTSTAPIIDQSILSSGNQTVVTRVNTQ